MVSGANRGLGKAVARRLHEAGWNVSAGGRDREAVIEAMSGCEGERLLCHRYDAKQPGRDRKWLDATVSHFGGLDALVNNAGILYDEAFADLTEEMLDDMWAVNVKAPFRLIQLALPHLAKTGNGRVMNLSSLSGLRVKGTFAPGYAMSKHAMTALTEATKQAAWDDGVRVTAVCPGFIATDMTTDFGEDQDTMIDPDDLAELMTTVLSLPNTAQVAQLTVSCRLEPHI